MTCMLADGIGISSDAPCLVGGSVRAQAIVIGHTAAVTDQWPSPLNLNVLLGAVEAAPPVAAAEVVGDALSEALGARDVSVLIADYSGRSLIRLSQVPRGMDTETSGRERRDLVPLSG